MRGQTPGGKTSPKSYSRPRTRLLRHGVVGVAWAEAGTPPEHAVSADVTFDQVEAGWRVVSSQLTVRRVVPGMSNEDFVAAAEVAKDGCPVDQTLKATSRSASTPRSRASAGRPPRRS